MPNNKKHHFVPRFYLRRFSKDGKSINLYNFRSGRKIGKANLANQCYRDYFYGKDLTIEHSLAMTEGEMAGLLRLIDKHREPPPFGTPAHFNLLIHILMQHGRTSYTAEAVNELFNKFTQQIFGEQLKEEGIDLSKFIVGMKEPAAFALGASVQAYPLIIDLRSKLLINRSGEEFITSDNPVVLYNQLMSYRTVGSNCGFASKGLQIFLPLDYEKLLVLYDDVSYRVGSDSKNVIEIDNPQDVYELNTLQACSANENVYFTSPEFNVKALHKKALPHLRSQKVKLRTALPIREPEGSSQLIGGSIEDVRTNLTVSVFTLRKSAKRWRDDFRGQKMQPVMVPRSPELLKDYRAFEKACKQQEYRPSEFFKFLEDRELARKPKQPTAGASMPGAAEVEPSITPESE